MSEMWFVTLMPSVISPLAYSVRLKLTDTSQNALGSFAHAQT